MSRGRPAAVPVAHIDDVTARRLRCKPRLPRHVLQDGPMHWCPPGCVHLTLQEVTLVALVAEGLSNREISARIGLTRQTVKNYLRRIFIKVGVHNRSGLVMLANRLGIVK